MMPFDRVFPSMMKHYIRRLDMRDVRQYEKLIALAYQHHLQVRIQGAANPTAEEMLQKDRRRLIVPALATMIDKIHDLQPDLQKQEDPLAGDLSRLDTQCMEPLEQIANQAKRQSDEPRGKKPGQSEPPAQSGETDIDHETAHKLRSVKNHARKVRNELRNRRQQATGNQPKLEAAETEISKLVDILDMFDLVDSQANCWQEAKAHLVPYSRVRGPGLGSKNMLRKVEQLWIARRKLATKHRMYFQFKFRPTVLAKIWGYTRTIADYQYDKAVASLWLFWFRLFNGSLFSFSRVVLLLLFLLALLHSANPSLLPRMLAGSSTLADYQRTVLLADSDEDRQEAARQALNSYLSMPIADSISQRIDADFQALLRDEDAASDLSPLPSKQEPRHVRESALRDGLRRAFVRLATGEVSSAALEIKPFKALAQSVDAGVGGAYWTSLFERAQVATVEEASVWLKAELAIQHCSYNHDKPSHWMQAEQLGALGLRYLSVFSDQRLKLDVTQRIQYIWYFYRGFNDLSVALADNSLRTGKSLHYTKRLTGIAYHRADALYIAGEYQDSLNEMQGVIDAATADLTIPDMTWYLHNGLLVLGEAQWRAGQYESALETFESLEQYELSDRARFNLHIDRGLVNGYLGRVGNYGVARREFDTALKLAQENGPIENQMEAYHHLGFLNYELGEYERALDDYALATELLDAYNPGNVEQQANLLVDVAKAEGKLGRVDRAFQLTRQASEALGKLGNQYIKRTNLLGTLGRLHLELDDNSTAVEYFLQADSICKEHGLVRLEIHNKPFLCEALLGAGETERARAAIDELESTARDFKDQERIVSVLVLRMKLARREDNLTEADGHCQKLLSEVETLLGTMSEYEMRSFCQKIYGGLKEAALLQIQLGRNEQALAILDYAKSRYLNPRFVLQEWPQADEGSQISKFQVSEVQQQIPHDALVLDYLVTDDSLHVFVVDSATFEVVSTDLDLKSLDEKIKRFRRLVDSTGILLDSFAQRGQSRQNFASIQELQKEFYASLLGWGELAARIENTTILNLIPDEQLYAIPFSTLFQAAPGNPQHLAGRMAIRYLPSVASVVNRATVAKVEPEERRVLVSVDPKLRGSKTLVSDVQAQFPQAKELAVSSNNVTIDDIVREISAGYDLLIFVGHSEANARYPELSLIEVFVKNADTDEKRKFRVTAKDLSGLHLQGTDMAMLVGCGTAGRKIYRNAGHAGMQQHFLRRGAKTVFASLWDIDAGRAMSDISAVLRHWAVDGDAITALQKTQKAAIDRLQQDDYYGAPHIYLWGSYVVESI